jgi:hypothetical protein
VNPHVLNDLPLKEGKIVQNRLLESIEIQPIHISNELYIINMTRIIKNSEHTGRLEGGQVLTGEKSTHARRIIILMAAMLLVLTGGCDKGLAPVALKTGFGGVIHFVSSWPPVDSVLDLRVVAVPYYPVDTLTSQLIDKILSGVIPYSLTALPLQGDSNMTVAYEMLIPATRYYYIAVVQQYGADVFHDWRVVGAHTNTTSLVPPFTVNVIQDVFVDSINITVDFKHLPPQPFKP